jgi:hypothetical protein
MKHEVLTLPQKARNISRITIDPADIAEYTKAEQALVAEIKETPNCSATRLFNVSLACGMLSVNARSSLVRL